MAPRFSVALLPVLALCTAAVGTASAQTPARPAAAVAPPLLYGTCVNWVFVTMPNRAPARCIALPAPDDA